LIAIDRDPGAIASGEALVKQDKRFSLHHATLGQLGSVLRQATGSDVGVVNGVLADLGVSSPQLDEQDRGFSFRFDGPLDMRMDTTQGETVEEWLNRADEQDIGEVIWRYGEERFARQIARAVVAARIIGRIRTTRELAELVGKTVRTREPGQHPATRTFQALRIFINQELEEVELVLPQAVRGLRTGGRLAVIAFHSLEDRIVKRFLQNAAKADHLPSKLPIRANEVNVSTLSIIGKPVRPSDAEVAANPRARSAIMRIAERLEVRP
jgi:16S rRNA (cytosine1402-N4)-methyltransferase